MKRIIEKKVWPEFFQKIIDGDKKCELRLDDFDCTAGDTLILKEWDPKTRAFTGRRTKKIVTHILKTKDLKFWPKKEIEKYGLQVISFK